MTETKPRQLSCLASIAYSDFRAAFREVGIDRRFCIADSGPRRPANPNKPNIAKTFVFQLHDRETSETNPTTLSFLLSVCYSDFSVDFRQTWIDERWLSVRNSGERPVSGRLAIRDSGFLQGPNPMFVDKKGHFGLGFRTEPN